MCQILAAVYRPWRWRDPPPPSSTTRGYSGLLATDGTVYLSDTQVSQRTMCSPINNGSRLGLSLLCNKNSRSGRALGKVKAHRLRPCPIHRGGWSVTATYLAWTFPCRSTNGRALPVRSDLPGGSLINVQSQGGVLSDPKRNDDGIRRHPTVNG